MYHLYQQRIVDELTIDNTEVVAMLELERAADIRRHAARQSFLFEMPERIRTQGGKDSCFVKCPVTIFEALLKLVSRKNFDFKATLLAEKIDPENKGGYTVQGFRGITEHGIRQHGLLKSSPFEKANTVILDTKFVSMQSKDNYRLRNPLSLKMFLCAFGPLALSFHVNSTISNPPRDADNIVNGCYLYVPPEDQNFELSDNENRPLLHYFTCYGWIEHAGAVYFGLRNTKGKQYGENGTIFFTFDGVLGPKIYDIDLVSAMWTENLGSRFGPKNQNYDAFRSFEQEFMEDCKNAFNA